VTDGSLNGRRWAEAVCPYCGVGCRLHVELSGPSIKRIVGVPGAPANDGRLCAKGATLGHTIRTPDRITHPWIRPRKDAALRPASWEETWNFLLTRLNDILRRHGPRMIGFYGSGQLDSIAAYCAVKLFKGYLGTNNTDSNSRLCMATAVAAYRHSLGSDGPPPCYEDIEEADVFLVIGSNMAEAHPVTFERVLREKRRRAGVKLVVVDPRRTATAERADFHIPVRPGGDLGLLCGLAKAVLEQDATDRQFIAAHTVGFREYAARIHQLPWPVLCELSGVRREEILSLAALLRPRVRLLSFYCMGLGQSVAGLEKITALVNLHLLVGAIGKPGAGPFSLTGQPNAMGGREVGLLTDQLPGYRTIYSQQERGEVEEAWGLSAGAISSEPGLTALEMVDALDAGQLRLLWVAATNPLVSMPQLAKVRRAFRKAELLVVQDLYHPTETTLLADVLLPAAGWGERESIMTSSDRTVSYSAAFLEPPGEARPDWEIFCELGRRLGFPGFRYRGPGEVWDEFIGLTEGRFCDMSGMPWARLKQQRHLRWPCPEVDRPGTQRLYEDGRFAHPDGRARFVFSDPVGPKEAPDEAFPLRLLTGRLDAHWHTLTRTGKVRPLVARHGQPYVEVHPETAQALRLQAGALVRVTSRRGAVHLPLRISERVPPDTVFVPMHWGDLHVPGQAINYITLPDYGPTARQPELKHCAVKLVVVSERADPASTLQGTSNVPVAKPRPYLPKPNWMVRTLEHDRSPGL
jgi:ferredoxin-nitrate reductase